MRPNRKRTTCPATFFARAVAAALAVTAALTAGACRGGGEATPTRSAPTTASAKLREIEGVLYQRDPAEALSVYAPAGDGGPWPVVVMIHGGGAFHLDDWARDVARHGAVTFVPYWSDNSASWTSATEFRADVTAIRQLTCAVRFAAAEAERYGGDPSNFTLFGHSAGAGLASSIAFSEPRASKGCLAPAGRVVPDNLVLFDGDWLLGGLPVWDDLLREDRRVFDDVTPWSHLEGSDRIPVQILDSADPALSGPLSGKAAERWLALRDPTGRFYRELTELGALADGVYSAHDGQRLLSQRLRSLGYPTRLRILPASGHEYLSAAGHQVLAEAILSR